VGPDAYNTNLGNQQQADPSMNGSLNIMQGGGYGRNMITIEVEC
jgi:hypothetical protein